MKDKRFWCGIALSSAWLLVMAAFIIWGERPKEINGWGDFFAGFFAPIAFLWLVLGYMQQGDELRAQALELANSVRQQTALVDIGRAQLAQETAALVAERQAAHIAAQPAFSLRHEHATAIDAEGCFVWTCQLVNVGASVSSVCLFVGPEEVASVQSNLLPFIASGRSERVQFELDMNGQVRMVIGFTDGRGATGQQEATFFAARAFEGESVAFLPSINYGPQNSSI